MTAIAAPDALLTEELRKSYGRDGYLVLRQFVPAAAIASASAEAEELLGRRDLIAQDNLRCRWQKHHDTGECLFETFDPVIDLGPVCARLATAPRLLAMLGELYGEPACLFKDKLIFKPPGVFGYGLHQDWIAWPGFPRSFLTALIPLDAADADNGCTIVYPGYHRGGCLSPEDGEYHELPAETVDEELAVPLVMAPGDVAVFGAFVPHRSAPNRSSRWRRQLYLSYNALSDGGPQRERHYEEFHAWLRLKYAEYGKTEVYFE
jgi:ectoine hydroxylase-related dioxygenase (phytanoyl-CoA dioxygenase family)